jgi:hypothetical protein
MAATLLLMDAKMVQVLIGGFIFLSFLAAVGGVFYLFRYLFQYEILDRIVRVKLIGVITLRRIRLEDIDEVRLISWAQRLPFVRGFRVDYLFAEHWPSYFFPRKLVFIKKRKGISRNLVLFPKDPQEFVAKISQLAGKMPAD